LSDKTGAYTYGSAFKAALNRMANKKGRYLNWEQFAELQISNTISLYQRTLGLTVILR
jgi:hypothetical protein